MPILFDEKNQKKQLEELRQQEEEDLARILSTKYGLEYADLSRASINTDALQLISEKNSRDAEVAAFKKVGKKISIALRSPNNKKALASIRALEDRGYLTTQVMVSTKSLERAWARYKDLSYAVETKAGVLDISGEDIRKIIQSITSLNDVIKIMSETLKMKKAYRISRILETMLAGGFSLNASDVHIEPEETYVRLRYRLDGVLTDILTFDRETYELLLSRIKLISGLKLNVRNMAQDGRFSVRLDQIDIEIRTSILPGSYGESIVLRILNPNTIALPMDKLGIEDYLFTFLKQEIGKPNGMILTTGPTGSGKTTALYAFMRYIQTPEIKIITIEDPVEYHLAGIVQTQVDAKKYTFAQGLRSTLRQDPDIIMVGEIRDGEVAETAINAALTGHLVFSTLHTNNAAGGITRLLDMGVEDYLLTSTINGILAQRLVRRLEPTHAERYPASPEEIDRFELRRLQPEGAIHLYRPRPSALAPTGYLGRTTIMEFLVMNDALRRAVMRRDGMGELERIAREGGMRTMYEDGLAKALAGQTTIEEVLRVTEES